MEVSRLRLTFTPPVRAPLHPNSWTRPPGNTEYRVTSPFGQRTNPLGFHGALDIGNARLGGDVLAVADGVVLAVGNLVKPWSEPTTRWPSGNYGGLMVVIAHGPAVVSIYAHLAAALVNEGRKITRGTVIGRIGESGSAKGQGHLHFGLQARPNDVEFSGVVKMASTEYGLGVDLDPWPLLTGAAFLDAPGVAGLLPVRRYGYPVIVTNRAAQAGGFYLLKPISTGGRFVGWGSVRSPQWEAGAWLRTDLQAEVTLADGRTFLAYRLVAPGLAVDGCYIPASYTSVPNAR